MDIGGCWLLRTGYDSIILIQRKTYSSNLVFLLLAIKGLFLPQLIFEGLKSQVILENQEKIPPISIGEIFLIAVY